MISIEFDRVDFLMPCFLSVSYKKGNLFTWCLICYISFVVSKSLFVCLFCFRSCYWNLIFRAEVFLCYCSFQFVIVIVLVDLEIQNDCLFVRE